MDTLEGRAVTKLLDLPWNVARPAGAWAPYPASVRATSAAVRAVQAPPASFSGFRQAMPATDYLLPGGLEGVELAALLAPLGAADGLAGLSIGCLNPEKDAGGAGTARTAALVARALAG